MTIQTSTSMLNIFATDSYGADNGGIFDYYDFDRLEETEGTTAMQAINEGMMAVAEELLEDAIDPIISCKVKAVKVVNPRQYNYTTDNTIVDITFNENDFNNLKEKTVKDPAFSKYLKDDYSSYSGFVSYMANNLGDFYKQDIEKQFSQVVSFYISDDEKENYQYKFYDYLDEWMVDNYGYLWVDDEDDYYNESFSRKVKPMVKKIKNEVYKIGSYGYTDTWDIIDGLKKYCEASYNLDKVEEALYKVEVYAESNTDFDELYKFLIDASGVYSFDD